MRFLFFNYKDFAFSIKNVNFALKYKCKLPDNSMRKSLFALSFLALAAMVQSCVSDPDQHQLQIAYPNNPLLFADATQDSLLFFTFDSWKVTPNHSWLSVEGITSGEFKYDYNRRYLVSVPVALQPNTTGESRIGSITVDSYEYTAYGIYLQLGYLNITNIPCKVTSLLNDYSSVPKTVDFQLSDSAFVTRDSICFNVQKSWNLSFPHQQPSWIQLERTEGFSGNNKVYITLEENPTFEDRKTTLRLTSSGVNTDIAVTQFARKKKAGEQ